MKKVLVVDDSKTIRTMCEWIYKSLEDRILTADSAAAARSVIDSESPDVVIVDYTLPDEDSYEFVSSIKSRTHVIMMGGTYAPFSAEKAIESGAEAVLMKPFKTDVFFQMVDDAATGRLSDSETVEAAPAAEVSNNEETLPPPAATLPMGQVAPAGGDAISMLSPSVAEKPAPAINSITAPINKPSVPSIAKPGTSSNPTIPGISPISSFGASKRFNFPAQTAAQAAETQAPAFTQQHAESATPKSPVASVSSQNASEQPATAQIDPAVLRAEVIAAVKSLLPAIVNSYLKKLIQAEVKPQLQNWVDTRVESLLKKLQQ